MVVAAAEDPIRVRQVPLGLRPEAVDAAGSEPALGAAANDAELVAAAEDVAGAIAGASLAGHSQAHPESGWLSAVDEPASWVTVAGSLWPGRLGSCALALEALVFAPEDRLRGPECQCPPGAADGAAIPRDQASRSVDLVLPGSAARDLGPAQPSRRDSGNCDLAASGRMAAPRCLYSPVSPPGPPGSSVFPCGVTGSPCPTRARIPPQPRSRSNWHHHYQQSRLQVALPLQLSQDSGQSPRLNRRQLPRQT